VYGDSGNGQCESFRELIIAKCELGLPAKGSHQDLVADHGLEGQYWSVNQYVRSLGSNRELSFSRMEAELGEEL